MSILTETRVCLEQAVKMERSNVLSDDFIKSFNTEYTDLTDEVKTIQLVKKSLDLIAVKGSKRSKLYALHSASITIRHLLAEATQLSAVVENELNTMEGE